MFELLTLGLITFPVSPLGFATSGYMDSSFLMQLQPYQSVATMFGSSVVASLGPQRLMYDEELQTFIYVTEVLGA